MKVWIIKYHVDGLEKKFIVKENELPADCVGDNIITYVVRRFYETVHDFDDVTLVRSVLQTAVA